MKRVVAYFAAAAFAVLGAFAGMARAQSDAAPASKLPESFLSANGQEFKLVSPGVFMMGNGEPVAELIKKFPGGQQSSMETSVSRRVTLTQPFYLATRLTTVGDFRRFVEATGYKTTAEQKHAARALDSTGAWADMPGLNWQEPGFEQGSKSPVVCVSYYDALAYVRGARGRDDGVFLGRRSRRGREIPQRGGRRGRSSGPKVDERVSVQRRLRRDVAGRIVRAQRLGILRYARERLGMVRGSV